MADSLASALAELQTKLPEITKSKTAHVRSEKGNYSYAYADLAAVTKALLPVMGGLGLSFTARPTVNERGQFVLAYALRHASDSAYVSGEYPLPSAADRSPQAIGSAITYARRYALCAVTGAVAEEDDDGAKAEAEHQQDEWETAAKPPTKSQTAKFDELAKGIAAAESAGGLKVGWDLLVAAYKADEITTVQANELKAEITSRKEEISRLPTPGEPM